jgi:hypothetical protein
MEHENDTAGFDYADIAPFLPWFVLFATMAYILDKLKFWKKKEIVSSATYEPSKIVQYKKKREYL